jgi:hypothetical protein
MRLNNPVYQPIKHALHIHDGEGRLVAYLLLHSFCNGITIGFMGASISALFLMRYTAADLPLMYIVSTSMIFFTGIIYHRLSKKLRFRRLLTANLCYSFSLILTLTLAYRTLDVPFPALLLAASFELIWVMNSLEFWGLTGKLFDVRQAKRLYGVVGAGEVVAIILSGFMIPFIVPIIGTANLLFIALMGTSLSLVMMRTITHRYADRLSYQPVIKNDTPLEPASRSDRSHRQYVFLIFALVGLTVSTLYIVDTAFYDQASQLYPDEASLASFLGLFFSVAGILQLVSRTIITGRLLKRYGVMIGLLVFPSLLILGGIGVLIGAGIGDAMLIAGAVILMKWVDRGLRYTLNQSTILILYQPLPTDQRVPVQARAESNIEAVAGFSVGIFLLFLTSTIGFGTVELILLMIVVCALWITIVWLIRKPYVTMLVQTLTFQRVTTTDTTLMPMIIPTEDAFLPIEVLDADAVHLTIMAEVETALLYLETGQADKLHDTKRRILRLLVHIIHPPALILEIEQHILLPMKERRAYALEALEMLLMSPIKGVIMPLYEDLPPHEQGKKLREALKLPIEMNRG